MKYIKKISELFDTEELKGEFEMPFMTGEYDIKNMVKNATPFQDPEIGYLNNKLMDKYPFLEYCMDYSDEFGINKDDEYENCYHYYFKKDSRIVVFSIIVHGRNDYDACIVSKEGKQDIYSNSYENCDLEMLYMIIKSALIDQLVDNGFGWIMSREGTPKSWNDN